MPPLTIVSSDRPSTLVERLALDLGRMPIGPFSTETIIVQSRGTERWIEHELARRHGCAASLSFPFAASFFRTLATTLNPADAERASAQALKMPTTRAEDSLDRDTLTWRILDLLETGISDSADFEPLRDFVGAPGDRDTRKLLGLAGTIASRFAEYQLYRPELLLAWESDDSPAADMDAHESWQRTLWRRLSSAGHTDVHLARSYMEAVDILNAATARPCGLPDRLSVFGVNTLPPVFVQLLHAVGRHIPVRLYLQAPRRESWSSSATQNLLWATFGRVTRELVSLLETHAPSGSPVAWEEHYRSADDVRTILSRLQSDVRNGIQRGPELGLAAPIQLRTDTQDDSLAVHRCHSPMREMEVLRDQLLAAFAADRTLRPHDVLLLLPDVATYAPFVDAVFGVGEPGLPHIPHRIADRPIAQESRFADAALRILRLFGARWTSAEVVELLEVPAVQRAAGIPDGATSQILRWIQETNIRWGRDGAMRSEVFNLPNIDANSWRAGVDRLLMGYATGPMQDLVDDIVPHAGHTIGDPETLGAFAAFTERLFDTLTGWRTARTFIDWSAELRGALTTFIVADGDDEERELEAVLSAVDALASVQTNADCDRAFELPVVRDWLEQMLGDDTRLSGFLSGGMTVCALKPMRVVPHRIVAVAGLDDATFPRSHQRQAFDLIATKRREGDRDGRADDRHLFIETLLATNERLILCYVARSAKTNVERAASVVVAELLDMVDASFVHPDPNLRAREMVEVSHRLQPFAPEYFAGNADGSRLFSYSAVNARALAQRAAGVRTREATFVTDRLPIDTSAIAHEVRLEHLIDCWTNPSRFFCERALGLRIAADDGVLDECEPMSVGRLDRYHVEDIMLRRHLLGRSRAEQDRAEMLARGQLPSGALSAVWYDSIQGDFSHFFESLGKQELQEPLAIAVRGATWMLRGRIDGITEEGRLQVRPANCTSKDFIRAWITHLALTAARGGPVQTVVVGTDRRCEFGGVAQPQPLLDHLVNGYRAALREPLPFFTRASHVYAEQRVKLESGASKAKKEPIDCARDAYDGSSFGESSTGDGADAYVALSWRGRDPFEDVAQFESTSLAFWRPALNAMIPIKARVEA